MTFPPLLERRHSLHDFGVVAIAIYVLFRFDTEDFVTPESNDALLAIAQALNERRIRATFPVVGEKARFLRRQGRDDVVRALKPHALGYHTHWHSVHPTLPERVEPLSWEEGLRALDETERPGLDAVTDVFGRFPCAYTQAGGTWLPHSHSLLSTWGIPIFYTETWNSYLDVVGSPYWMGESLGLTSPVTVTRVFDLASQGREAEARRQVDAALEQARAAGGGMVGFVAHPTELVTRGAFWDVLNFGGGKNLVPREGPYRRPELKPRDAVQADLAAFEAFLDHLLTYDDVEILAIDEYLERVAPRAQAGAGETDMRAVARSIAEGRIPPSDGRRHLSALEALCLLGEVVAQEPSPAFTTGPVSAAAPIPAPSGTARPAPSPVRAPISAWRAAWRSLAAEGGRGGGVLPATCRLGPDAADVPVETLLGALGAIVHAGCTAYPGVRPPEAVERLEKEKGDVDIVAFPYDPAAAGLKPVERLHWDWPIFASGARFDRCYAWTRAQMWTFRRLPDPAKGGGARGSAGVAA